MSNYARRPGGQASRKRPTKEAPGMNWKKFACLLSVAGIGAVGCGDDSPPGGGGDCGDCNFVVSKIEAVNPNWAAGQAPGFDLDMMDSGTLGSPESCDQADLVSSVDGTAGVDNQLPLLAETLEAANTDLQASIDGAITDGTLILLVGLDEVDDLTNDPTIETNIYLGMAMADVMTSGGEIAAGQTFGIDMPVIQEVAGAIVNGKMDVSVPSLPLAIPVMDSTLNLEITNARVGAQVTETALTNGVIAGVLNVDQLVQAAVDLTGMDEGLIRPLLNGFADSNFDAATDQCRGISVGLGFRAVTANID